jgi:sugar phosphate isomerase/epimerase
MMVDSLEALLELLAAIDSKSLEVNFDPSHFSVRGWDVPTAIRKLSNHIVHTHFKGSRGLIPEYKWYIPGEYPDDIDAIREFALALKEIHFDGFISVEIANSRRTDILFDPKSAAQLAYKTFSSVLDQL